MPAPTNEPDRSTPEASLARAFFFGGTAADHGTVLLADQRFGRIFERLSRVNPNLEVDLLVQVYNGIKEWVSASAELQKPVGDSSPRVLPKGQLAITLFECFRGRVDYEEWNEYQRLYPNGRCFCGIEHNEDIHSNRLLDFLKTECLIDGAWERHQVFVEEDPEYGPMHVAWLYETLELIVPEESADLVCLYLSISEDVFRRLLYGSSPNLKAEFKLHTHTLGEGAENASWGGKEKGFFVLEALELPYPLGIVLSPELVSRIAAAAGSPQGDRSWIWLIRSALSELNITGLFDKSCRLMVRSNPRLSAPGVFKSIKVDSMDELLPAICAAAKSWDEPRAREYRQRQGLPDEYDLSLIIQEYKGAAYTSYWTAGQPDPDFSPEVGAGVFCTRNPNTGASGLFGRFRFQTEGSFLMSGCVLGQPLENLEQKNPDCYQVIKTASEKLEAAVGPQEVEFVIAGGRPFFVQTRRLNFAPQAELAFLTEKVSEDRLSAGLIAADFLKVLERCEKRPVYRLAKPLEVEPFAAAQAAGTGAFAGALVWREAAALKYAASGQPIIAVLAGRSEERNRLLQICFDYPRSALVVLEGNDCSHEAVLSRLSGVPALISLPSLRMEGDLLKSGKRAAAQGDGAAIDCEKKELYLGSSAVLQETSLIDLSPFRIDISAYRRECTAPFVDLAGELRPDVSLEQLRAANAKAAVEFERRFESGDRRGAFLANLRKHFLHEVLEKKLRA